MKTEKYYTNISSFLVFVGLIILFPHTSWSIMNNAEIMQLPVYLDYNNSSIGLETPKMEEGRTEIEIADVNSDGFVDLISIGDHGSPYVNSQEHGIMVWFGDGGYTWTSVQSGMFGYGGVCIGDVNGDGLMDAGYAMHHNWGSSDFGDQLIEVALGDGSGFNWFPWDDGLAVNGEDWGMFGTDFADVDCDGDLDIVSISFGGSSGIHVYLNRLDGSWVQSFGFIGGNSDEDIVFGEVNGDGYPDFAAAHEYGTVFIGDGTGGFTNADGNLPGGGWMGRCGMDLGDVDGDGCDDLSWASVSGGVEVWRWTGNGSWQDFSGHLPSNGPFQATQLADMDMDGYMDVVAYGDNKVAVWRGDGQGHWLMASSFLVASEGDRSAFRVGPDIDHNGRPDIVLVNQEGGWLHGVNKPYCFLEASEPDLLMITAIHPVGREHYAAGSVRLIEWVSAVPDHEITTVDIELSISGEQGPWSTIGADVPDNGRWQWLIPERMKSEDCRIRLTVKTSGQTASSVTPASFEIF